MQRQSINYCNVDNVIGQRVGVEIFITRDDYDKDTFENDLAILR